MSADQIALVGLLVGYGGAAVLAFWRAGTALAPTFQRLLERAHSARRDRGRSGG